MTLISIIIPAYRSGSLIGRALQSVNEQSASDWELAVIDDASEDNTECIVRAFSDKVTNKVIYIKNTVNKGPAACRNIGLQETAGQFVAFLDADDFWEKEHLEKSLEVMEKGRDFCYSGFYIFDRYNNKILDIFSPGIQIIKNPLYRLFSRSFIQTASSVMLSRNLIKSVGRFDEEFLIGEDRDYWLRAMLQGFKIFYTGYPTCYYSKHGGNMMLDTLTVSKNEVNFYRKYLHENKLPLQLRKKCYSDSLFNNSRLIMGEDPERALRQYLEAWSVWPFALNCLLWAGFLALKSLSSKG